MNDGNNWQNREPIYFVVRRVGSRNGSNYGRLEVRVLDADLSITHARMNESHVFPLGLQ
jgi:hypothetical protein